MSDGGRMGGNERAIKERRRCELSSISEAVKGGTDGRGDGAVDGSSVCGPLYVEAEYLCLIPSWCADE